MAETSRANTRGPGAILLGVLLLAACDRPAPPSPPSPVPKAPPSPPPIEEPSDFVDYAFRITKDARTDGGMACWGCYRKAQAGIRAVPGVQRVEPYPDEGYFDVRYERRRLRDRTDVYMALKKALPEVEIESIGALPEFSRRVRMTNQVPPEVRAILDQATDAKPLVVIKLTGRGACAACAFQEPPWGSRVVRADLDVDAVAGLKPWLAPQAVPEWVALDRAGGYLGRWEGAFDPAAFDEQLERLVAVASR